MKPSVGIHLMEDCSVPIGSCHAIFPRISNALVYYFFCACKFIFDSFLCNTGHVFLVLDLVVC